MKKILSALVALCMVLSMTAFATTTNAKINVTADSTEVKAGDVITFTVKSTGDGDMSCWGAVVKFDYDKTQLSIDKDSYKTDLAFSTSKISVNDTTITVQNTPNPITDTAIADSGVLKGEILIGEFKATVLDTVTPGSTIKFTSKQTNVTYANLVNTGTAIQANDKVAVRTLNSIPTITIQSSTPSKPTISIDPDSVATGENNGIVDINIDNDNSTYSVNVTAPIGKTAVIYLNNEPQTGSSISGTATVDTVIKVAYTDAAGSIITYGVPMADVYGTNAGIVAFGKATIADGDSYGIKFGGLTGTYKDITDYKFPATGNADGIFAVEIADAEAGNYTAQAYVNSDFGNEITITK